jgi:tight adherence protein B
MTLAITAFFLTFGTMVLAYMALRARQRRAEIKAQASRVAERDHVRPMVLAKKAPALIRKDQPQRSGPFRALSDALHFNQYIRNLIEGAAARSTPSRFFRLCVISAICGGGLVFTVAHGALAFLAIPAAALCGVLPLFRLKRTKRRRIEAFQAQFPEGLEFVSRSMRAGHAFSVSLEMLHREFDEPMAGEFRRIFEEQNLGLPLDIALGKFAIRMPLLDVQFFTSAVLLQRKTGGNLTEILDKLAQLIRERYKLHGKIRTVSAHGRMTGKVLSAIPIFVGALMFYVNPDYGTFFMTTTEGREMIGAAAALQVIGYLTIQRIVKIEV